MARKYYWPSTLTEQVAALNNFSSKIEGQSSALGWTPAQVTAAKAICTQMVVAFNYADESRTTMQAVSAWREMVFSGDPMGTPMSDPPAFVAPPDMSFIRGCVKQFNRIRDQIVSNDNYTEAIGEDLGLIGPEITPPSPNATQPNLKITTASSENPLSGTDSLVISGSMQNMSGMKLIYTPKGGAPREVGFVTSMPVTITITKTDPNEPESGSLQAQYYKKNQPFGNLSPSYPITLA